MRPILLISDDELQIEATRDLLTHMGFDVCVAESPTEASLFCEIRRPSAVIADIEMPGGNGFEAISMVKKIARDCFVIAATRGDHKELWPMVGIARGADAYVVGPLTTEKLAKTLQTVGKSGTDIDGRSLAAD